MNAEQKKEMVKTAMQAMLRGDMETAGQYVTDDVRWVIAPSLSKTHPSITSKKEWMARNSAVKTTFPEGLKTEIQHIFCDGDAVIVEFTNKGKVANGKFYDNVYCTVFALRGDKIAEIREYQDSLHVQQTFHA